MKNKILEELKPELKKIFPTFYLYHNDKILPDYVPLFLEYKNQNKKIDISFKDAFKKCPKDKYPVLIYKLNNRKIKVMMSFDHLLNFLTDMRINNYESQLRFKVEFSIESFLNLLALKYIYFHKLIPFTLI